MTEDDIESLKVRCPRCGLEQIDVDGFGFQACQPHPEGCGYCLHPMLTNGVCMICGAKPREHQRPLDSSPPGG